MPEIAYVGNEWQTYRKINKSPENEFENGRKKRRCCFVVVAAAVLLLKFPKKKNRKRRRNLMSIYASIMYYIGNVSLSICGSSTSICISMYPSTFVSVELPICGTHAIQKQNTTQSTSSSQADINKLTTPFELG